jgi:hypothetical protein
MDNAKLMDGQHDPTLVSELGVAASSEMQRSLSMQSKPFTTQATSTSSGMPKSLVYLCLNTLLSLNKPSYSPYNKVTYTFLQSSLVDAFAQSKPKAILSKLQVATSSFCSQLMYQLGDT